MGTRNMYIVYREDIMRWYDVEPDVCIAISMIELASERLQIDSAEYIIQRGKELDPDLNFIKNEAGSNSSEQNQYQRWYDKNETLSTAFRYLKCMTKANQIQISKEVLLKLREKAPA